MKRTTWLVTLALSLVAVSVAGATEAPLTYDRVHFSVGAGAEVENDTLVAVVAAQREGSDAATSASEVNRALRWAMERAETFPMVEAQTLDYRTTPIYTAERISGWRVSQSLRLKSQDDTALSELIGQLQERLGLRSIQYEVSRARRRAAEEGLLTEALAAFAQRARQITAALGREQYRIVELEVSTAGATPRPVMRQFMAVAAQEAAAPPMLEAGSQSVELSVRGTIELQLE